jgi:hypothetical protein
VIENWDEIFTDKVESMSSEKMDLLIELLNAKWHNNRLVMKNDITKEAWCVAFVVNGLYFINSDFRKVIEEDFRKEVKRIKKGGL